MKDIYVDNAATTRISDRAKKVFIDSLDFYGNPSSIHKTGVAASRILENARASVAAVFNCEAREIYFTSGGSEGNNWAIKKSAEAMKKKGKNHIVTSGFEHHAVLHPMQELEKEGFEVTYLDVYGDGYIRLADLEAAIRENTALVSIMYANNEIGTVMPVTEIGGLCRAKKILFHTDAVQAAGRLGIDVKSQNIDMMTISAHKFHGPKGIGALYIKKGIVFPNLIDGGAQERGKRAGTENAAAAASMAEALNEALENSEQKNSKIKAVRDFLAEGLLKIERSRVNGGMEKRLAGNLSVCFEGVEGEALLLWLDNYGISASSGSACTSGSLDPSHVLLALGLPHEIAHGSLRLSLSEENTFGDAEYIIEKTAYTVEMLRNMSPVWEKIKEQERKRI